MAMPFLRKYEVINCVRQIMARMDVWLASASARRASLLKEHLRHSNIWFASSPLQTKEISPNTGMEVQDRVATITAAKADAVVVELKLRSSGELNWEWLGIGIPDHDKPTTFESVIAIVADTLVADPDEPFAALGQPENELSAVSMLLRLSGRRHAVWTATALIYPKEPEVSHHSSRAIVEFDELAETDISELLVTDSWVGKAGAYDLAGEAGKFVRLVEGDKLSVLGLAPDAVDELSQRIKDLS